MITRVPWPLPSTRREARRGRRAAGRGLAGDADRPAAAARGGRRRHGVARARAVEGGGRAAAAAARARRPNRVVPVLTAEVEQQRRAGLARGPRQRVGLLHGDRQDAGRRAHRPRRSSRRGSASRRATCSSQIDPRPFAIQLETAQAALARDAAQPQERAAQPRALQDAQRAEPHRRQQYTDQQALGRPARRAGRRPTRPQIDAARLNLDYARITSPIDGVTGVRLVDPGNLVHAADTTGIVVVTQLDPIAVFFTLPQDDLPADRRGAWPSGDARRSRRSAATATQRSGTGKLDVIDNQINQATATIRLKAIFANPKHAALAEPVREGAPAARRRARTRSSSPRPRSQHGPSGTFAYVVGAGLDRRRCGRSTLDGHRRATWRSSRSGLAAGEQVVVDGQAQLRPGAKVATSARPEPGGTRRDAERRARSRRPRRAGRRRREQRRLRAVHPAAGRDDAADGRPAARRASAASRSCRSRRCRRSTTRPSSSRRTCRAPAPRPWRRR